MIQNGSLLLEIFGLVVLGLTMRFKGDGRSLHDVIAGTRVVSLPRDQRRRVADPRRSLGRDRGSVLRPVGVLQSVGPYKVRGAIRWEPDRRVVAGEDSTLGREAWIVIRPKGSPAPDAARREIARATRPRWLAGGEQHEGRWDAFVAPAGCPVADLAGPDGLTWHETRPILEDLADELASSCRELTLQTGLTVDQIWIQPDGRAILVDSLGLTASSVDSDGLADQARALDLLRKVAAVALEGGRRRSDKVPEKISSPVPIHASAILNRLLGGKNAYPSVDAFRAELEATRHQPTEVAIGQRATHLGVMALFLSLGLVVAYSSAYFLIDGPLDQALVEIAQSNEFSIEPVRKVVALVSIGSFPLLWVVWNLLARGGVALKLAGLGLVRSDGRLAPRWRCCWRALLVWTPVTVLLLASVWVHWRIPTVDWPGWFVFGLAVALLPLYVVSALLLPHDGPHDRLSGLRVVPR